MRMLFLLLISIASFGQTIQGTLIKGAECVDPNVLTDLGNGNYMKTAMGGYTIKKWVHKQPDFQDFIMWVRKKYKQ